MEKARKTAIYVWGAVNVVAVFIVTGFLLKYLDDQEMRLIIMLSYFGYSVIAVFVFLNILKKYPKDNDKK